MLVRAAATGRYMRQTGGRIPARSDMPAFPCCQGTFLRNEIEACDAVHLDEATHRATAAMARRHGLGGIKRRMPTHMASVVR